MGYTMPGKVLHAELPGLFGLTATQTAALVFGIYVGGTMAQKVNYFAFLVLPVIIYLVSIKEGEYRFVWLYKQIGLKFAHWQVKVEQRQKPPSIQSALHNYIVVPAFFGARSKRRASVLITIHHPDGRMITIHR